MTHHNLERGATADPPTEQRFDPEPEAPHVGGLNGDLGAFAKIQPHERYVTTRCAQLVHCQAEG
eukprot:7003180-Pyramimonas_sp.AAC.1